MISGTPIAREPFFIIGSPRSGTTLLRLILTCHPALVVPPECGFAVWLEPVFGSWGGREFADPENISDFVNEVSASRKFSTWALSPIEITQAIVHAGPRTYGEACAAIYQLYCAKSGKEAATWGDKNNHYLDHVADLASIFPGARFIHLVRDGRDVACSYREVMAIESVSEFRPSLPVEIRAIAARWADDVAAIRRQFEALPPDRTIVLRYEDLVADPARELVRVCAWMGLSYSPDMLQFHAANRLKHLEPLETMDWKTRTLDPVTSDTVARHEFMLTPGECREFERIAGTELRDHSYLARPDASISGNEK